MCVRSLSLLILFVTLAVVDCGAVESPVPFVKKPVVEPRGLPGWYGNPARLGETAFAFSYWRVPVVEDLWAASAAGEWNRSGFRMAFFQYYSEMDTLLHETYGELDLSYSKWNLVVGSGYGALLAWVDSDARWIRHRLKFGAGYQWRRFCGSLWTMGFTDEGWSAVGGVHWRPSSLFSLFVETSGHSLDLGHEFCYKYGCIASHYAFPNFSVGVELVLGLKTWSAGYNRGFGKTNLDWEGLWFQKKSYFQEYDSYSKDREH